MAHRFYACIDLKSFYASVECVERGLDPLTTNLVVADASRTEKTICLAVSPSMKAHGISGRARLFEVVQKIQQVNTLRKRNASSHTFTGSSCNAKELAEHPSLELSYIVAPPRMAHYIHWSTRVYQTYLKYVAPEDIHVYSIDEVFLDLTPYLEAAKKNAHDFVRQMIRDVLQTTGITATGGIGTNLYLAKIAMDVEAKHIPADQDGVRIAQLDEYTYRKKLWSHTPLTDFWRVGKGYEKKLQACGLYTMGDIARCSLGNEHDFYNAETLYQLFGVNAELLIDHAWGWEPCTIADIKAYQPRHSSIGSGQVLHKPYPQKQARLVLTEMADLLALELVDKGLVTKQISLTVGYDISNLSNPILQKQYHGEITTDAYGRKIPKHAHGTRHLTRSTSSSRLLTAAFAELFDSIINPVLLVRRINLTAEQVLTEQEAEAHPVVEQLDFFTDYAAVEQAEQEESALLKKEKNMQKAMLSIKKKFGNNAILKGMNLQKGATAQDRNQQIGGHKA